MGWLQAQDLGQGEVDCVSGRNMQAFWLASARARQESVKSTAAKETAITIKEHVRYFVRRRKIEYGIRVLDRFRNQLGGLRDERYLIL